MMRASCLVALKAHVFDILALQRNQLGSGSGPRLVLLLAGAAEGLSGRRAAEGQRCNAKRGDWMVMLEVGFCEEGGAEKGGCVQGRRRSETTGRAMQHAAGDHMRWHEMWHAGCPFTYSSFCSCCSCSCCSCCSSSFNSPAQLRQSASCTFCCCCNGCG